MVSVSSLFRNLKMYSKGFKKVPLKDSKHVLNKTNNFKWVKVKEGVKNVVFPSGTQIEVSSGRKVVIKPNQEAYLRLTAADGSYKIYKGKNDGGIISNTKLIKEKTPQEVLAEKTKAAAQALNKKRQAFIDKFKAKFERKIVKHQDGSVSKVTVEKDSGRLRRWFNKDAQGNVKKGSIDYPLNGLSQIKTVETPNKLVVTETSPLTGVSSTISKNKVTNEVSVKTTDKNSANLLL